MLGRYQMIRGKRPADDPLPEGLRQDARKHTRHILRPDSQAVATYLQDPSEAAWQAFAHAYRDLLAARRAEDPPAFDALVDLATEGDVWIGCSCPTAKNPDVRHCHTYLALHYMDEQYDGLQVSYPDI
ncbi:MAG: hypothetical protein ACI8QZ_002613 [Chlamydiales bacterium]|jgi:hypothetical protein